MEKAVAPAAESVIKSSDAVFLCKPTTGKYSSANFSECIYMAAVICAMPIPSPTRKMTFFAVFPSYEIDWGAILRVGEHAAKIASTKNKLRYLIIFSLHPS